MDGCLCPGDTGPGPGTLSPVPGQCPHPLVVTAGAHTLTTAQLCTCCHTDNTHTTYTELSQFTFSVTGMTINAVQ